MDSRPLIVNLSIKHLVTRGRCSFFSLLSSPWAAAVHSRRPPVPQSNSQKFLRRRRVAAKEWIQSQDASPARIRASRLSSTPGAARGGGSRGPTSPSSPFKRTHHWGHSADSVLRILP